MKEARIECAIREFLVPDLKLKLRKGQVVFVDADRARRSSDLEDARRVGAVRVRFVERARMTKKPPKAPPRSPPPPNVRLSRKVRRTTPVLDPTPAASVDMDEVRRVAREAAEEGTAKGVEEGIRRALDSYVSQPTNAVTTENLKAALVEVLGGLNLGGGGAPAAAPSSKTKGPDEPVFIPKDIVSKGDKTELNVGSESSDAGDLDAAAAALKAAKPKRTRRKKTTAKKATEK